MHPPKSGPSDRARDRFRAALVLFAVLDFLKHVLLYGDCPVQPWSDSTGYWWLAKDVAEGDIWMWQRAWGFRTPGYPWFLGLVIQIAPGGHPTDGFLWAILIQHTLSLLTDGLVAWWTYRLTGSRFATVAAAAWMALSVSRPLYDNWILTESLATFCLAGAAYLIWSSPGQRPWRLIAGAALSGIGILIRPSLIVLALLILITGVIDGWAASRSWRRGLFRAALPIAVLLSMLAPWCIRNGRLFDRWTLVTFTGRELWTANFSPWPGANLDIPEDGAANELRGRIDRGFVVDLRHNASVSRLLSESGLSDAQTDRLMEQVAWTAIRRQPGRSAFHVLARTGTFWYCKEYPYPDVRNANLPRLGRLPSREVAQLLKVAPERTFLFVWTTSLLTWGAVFTSFWFPNLRRPGWIIGFLLASTTVLTATLEIPLYRYRLPLEPLGVLIVVVVGHAWILRWRERRSSPPPVVGEDKTSTSH